MSVREPETAEGRAYAARETLTHNQETRLSNA